jgi:hypothetical protein
MHKLLDNTLLHNPCKKELQEISEDKLLTTLFIDTLEYFNTKFNNQQHYIKLLEVYNKSRR